MDKKLLFVCGANGIGKTTVCRNLLTVLPSSAYVDTDFLRLMNPNVLDDKTVPVVQKNISALLKNYLECPVINTVIFSYGFHGRRKEIFDGVMKDISHMNFEFIPVLLVCSESENIRRMKADKRDDERIQRALDISRKTYDNISYPRIDVTNLSIDETLTRLFVVLNVKSNN